VQSSNIRREEASRRQEEESRTRREEEEESRSKDGLKSKRETAGEGESRIRTIQPTSQGGQQKLSIRTHPTSPAVNEEWVLEKWALEVKYRISPTFLLSSTEPVRRGM
jgi:hypothetical protein